MISSSPFSRAAWQLVRQGYSPIPILQGTKRPAIASGWSQFCGSRACIEQMEEWARAPGLGVGVALGGAVVAVDIDTDDQEINQAIAAVVPESIVSKRGRKGRTDFFYDPTQQIKARKIRSGCGKGGRMLVEVLAHGNQTVIPPSIHPDTCRPYAWTTRLTLENTPPSALPVLPVDIVERLESALARWLPTKRFSGRNSTAATQKLSRLRAYALAAMDAELKPFSTMGLGSGRNNELYRLACRFGRFVHHNVLLESELFDQLLNGCRANGLIDEDGEHSCLASIASGLRISLPDELPDLGPAPMSGSDAASPTHSTRPDMSILLRNVVPAPAFPLEVLGPAAQWVRETAHCKSAPVDFVALSLLASVAGLIGPKRFVSPWEEWSEPCILWCALVAPPSMNKSPATDPLRSAVRQIEAELNFNWEAEKSAHEQAKKIAEAAYAKWAAEVEAATNANTAAPDLPANAIAPKAPQRRQVWITDATTEKIARLLSVPGGLLCFRDELSGLLGSFDRYGGHGSDRAFWIEAYGGRSYRVDRVRLDESIDLQFCAVSILGAIQPDRLRTLLLSGDDDGLASRFLYAWPDAVAPRRPTFFPDASSLQDALRRLAEINFDLDEDHRPKARIIRLEPDASDEFQVWWEGDQWRAKYEAMGQLGSATGKLDGIALRLAQTIEYLSWAWVVRNTTEPESVSLQSVRSAIELIETWVRPMLLRVFTEASIPKAHRDATMIARWLLSNPQVSALNARELRRIPKSPAPRDSSELDNALALLRDAAWLFDAEMRNGVSRGRSRKDYLVNPLIHTKGVTDQ